MKNYDDINTLPTHEIDMRCPKCLKEVMPDERKHTCEKKKRIEFVKFREVWFRENSLSKNAGKHGFYIEDYPFIEADTLKEAIKLLEVYLKYAK